MTHEERLRVQFRKALQKGTCNNAVLDPVPSTALSFAIASAEAVIVRVDATDGSQYWFTSSRVIRESCAHVFELAVYSEVCEAAWMFRSRERMQDSMLDPNGAQIKTANFDRLELQLNNGDEVVLAALGQAYVPALDFFQTLR